MLVVHKLKIHLFITYINFYILLDNMRFNVIMFQTYAHTDTKHAHDTVVFL
jgi:hypothetical protein